MPKANQLERMREDVTVTAADLLAIPKVRFSCDLNVRAVVQVASLRPFLAPLPFHQGAGGVHKVQPSLFFLLLLLLRVDNQESGPPAKPERAASLLPPESLIARSTTTGQQNRGRAAAEHQRGADLPGGLAGRQRLHTHPQHDGGRRHRRDRAHSGASSLRYTLPPQHCCNTGTETFALCVCMKYEVPASADSWTGQLLMSSRAHSCARITAASISVSVRLGRYGSGSSMAQSSHPATRRSPWSASLRSSARSSPRSGTR